MNLQPGQKILHYELLEQIGSGGMSVVFKARDSRLERFAALKFLSLSSGITEEDKERFIQEARLISGLDHPNICTIYDIGETPEGQIFIAMAYYDGETLTDRIRRGRLPLDEALTITRQICDALTKAHSHGIVHRDIKPANIIINPDGMLKLLDFGIAKLHGKQRTTRRGMVLGTPGYMSPEQTRGKQVDHRSDIWAVGVILYEMLTGVLPFRGENDLSLMYAIVHEEPQPVAEFREDLPPHISAVLSKMLSKKPENRYQQTADLVRDLKTAGGASVPKQPATQPEPITSIAVLPMRDMSPDQDQAYFCDGLSESIITTLSRLKGLRVASRNSSFQYRDPQVPLSEIAEKLGVISILEGSVRKAENQIRIAVQLINPADGFVLWAEEFREEMHDIFEVQDRIACAVVDTLKVQLAAKTDTGIYKHFTENIDAYSAYLQGRFFWNQRTADAMSQSIKFFTEAIDLDPNYSLALAGLADTYIVLGMYGLHSPGQVLPRALETASRAIQLDDSVSAAHVSRGCVLAIHQWDWVQAEAEFQRSIELNSNNSLARHWYAINFLVPLERFEDALEQIEVARKLDPVSPVIATTVGLVHYYARQYDRAVEICRKAVETSSSFPMSHFFLGQALVQLKRFKEAMDHFEKAQALYGDSTNILATTAHAAAVMGKKKQAQKMLDRLQKMSATKYVSAYDIAAVYAGLGENENALDWLQKAMNERSYLLVYLKVDPVMDRLREESAFQSILKQMFGNF